MAAPARPETTDEMVYQLWFAVIGSNGDGLASQVRDTRMRVEGIEKTLPSLMTKEGHEAIEAAHEEHVERRKLTGRERAMLWATFLSSFAAIGAVVVSVVK